MSTPEEQAATAVAVHQWIEFRCIRLSQPIGDFYIGSIKSADLVEIAYADIRRIIEGKPRDIEEFSGIQRPLSKARSKEIRQYVTTVDASFPTSVIVHIKGEDAEFDEAANIMKVRKSGYVAKILDGQHRIDGLTGYNGPLFEVNTTIFVDMDMEDQALLFATINLKQTKVNKSLAYDLYEFATARSPQKTCHNIARLLNTEENGPFFHRIKILGAATKGRGETLTQATFIDRLILYISDDPMRDRDLLKRGKSLPAGTGKPGRPLCLRQLFKDEQDASIAKIISNYFGAVQDRWPIAWNDNIRGLILNRTAGFGALMRFFGVIYPQLKDADGPIVKKETFSGVFRHVGIEDTAFNTERYLPGTTGESRLYQDLVDATRQTQPIAAD
jgi:DGQHR domain-containing protein